MLTGRLRYTSHKYPVSKNSIVSQVARNEIFPVRNCEFAQLVTSEMSDPCRFFTPDSRSLSSDFITEELTSALQLLKLGKAAGPGSICPELIHHAGSEMKSWSCEFLSSCLHNLKIPKIWRKAVITILKANKPPGYPKGYQPIPLLCIPFKILRCCIYAHSESTITVLLPMELAGFQYGR